MECGFKVLDNGDLRPFNEVMAEEILNEFKAGSYVGGDLEAWSGDKMRTTAQNSAIHVYCRKLAVAFNEGGYDLKVVMARMKKKAFVSWTLITVKEVMWRSIQKALFKIDSTTKLDKKQVSEVYEHINRFTAEEFGISIPFPSRYEQSLEQIDKG